MSVLYLLATALVVERSVFSAFRDFLPCRTPDMLKGAIDIIGLSNRGTMAALSLNDLN